MLGGSTAECNTTGNFNTFIGWHNAMANTTGSNNIFLGKDAGNDATDGLAAITTQCNRIIMGNCAHTCAQIQIAWTAVSDARDKCIYGAVNKGLGFLKDVNPIEFAFKDRTTNELIGDGKKRYGFSAQEILSLEGDKPVIVSNDNPDKLFLTNDYLVPVLVNAIKELNAKVETLENKVRDLENN